MLKTGLWRMVASAALLVALGSTGCGGDESTAGGAPEGEWVGTIAGTDAWVAISAADGVAAAYVCGGPQTLSTHTRWWRATEFSGSSPDGSSFSGSSPDGSSDVGDGALSMDADGWQLATTLVAGTIGGSLTDPDGVVVSFDAEFSATGDLAGIFGALTSGCRSGVIVKSTSSSQGAFCDGIDFVSEVTPLMPIDAAGFTVTADTLQGPVEFLVEPLVPSDVVQ
jgi:hypothetical protein